MKIKFVFLSLVFALGAITSTALADEALNKELLNAVYMADVPKINDLLKKGADANARENDRSILGWASQSYDNGVVEALLAAKADPNNYDGVGHTPLMRAIETQQVKNVESLIKAKANVNLKTKDGSKTVLMMAVDSRKPEIVKAVIDAGADVKAVTAEGESPVLMAAQEGSSDSMEIIKILGAAKASMDTANAAYTPLSYAVNQGNAELVKVLLAAGANPNAKDKMGRTPLMQALDSKEVFDLLVAAKADANITDERGDTVLMRAIEYGTPELIESIIKAGADLNIKDSSGNTALKLADNMYKTDLVEVLKKHGATE